MFMGEYSHTIDAKGRMIIPSKLRDELSEEFVITRGLDGCLFVYPMEDWKELLGHLKQLPLNAKDAREMNRFFLSGATNGEIDKQGRVLIPSVLRNYAKITKDVVLLGVGNRIEIWDKDVWEGTASFDNMDEIADRISELGFSI